MKLLRYGPAGKEKPGLLDSDGKIRDLSKVIDDFNGATLSPASLRKIAKLPRRTFAIALNYAKHAAEANAKVPSEPFVFTKTCELTGPRDNIVLPKGSKKTDWEVELCLVMGRKAQHVSKRDALNYVAGYATGNEVSERAFLLEHGGLQWIMGKSPDTFAPLGPWLVTSDEVGNPQKLNLWLEVNGKRYQDESTADMIFISNMSKMITLFPGDVIYTGTPSGVGLGMKPPVYLKAGDVVTCGVEGLGEHRSKVVKYKA
jgi:2-keto-4-pentenoate hydratase/2-oxohepta-3-ene-1,7-dioic acid hydratase in catechol pathway